MAKLVILSLVDHSKYSKETLMYAFNCTRYRIDKARKWRASCEGLVLPKKEQLFRQCLDLQE